MFAFDYGVQTVVDVLGHFVVLGIGVFRPDIPDRPEKYTNVKGDRSETDGTPLYAFLPADSAGLTYLSVIPVLTFDDRDPMELES
jgi:hypothetical protein